jgi:hypothetical protein
MATVQRVMFFKNLSILGGALAFMYFGGGPLSIDAISMRRRARRSVLEQPVSPQAYVEMASQLPSPI